MNIEEVLGVDYNFLGWELQNLTNLRRPSKNLRTLKEGLRTLKEQCLVVDNM
jgi:hypothetical protein